MTELTEEWALTAPAGPELDRVCAEWMGMPDGYWRSTSPITGNRPKKFSTDWSDAGPLLEAMNAFGICRDTDTGLPKCYVPGGVTYMSVRASAESLLLAIARACAVLAARGVERGDI